MDNLAENFQFQQENGIFIKSWLSDPSDTALFELAPLLVSIAESGIEDVRTALTLFRDHMLELMGRGVENPTLILT